MQAFPWDGTCKTTDLSSNNPHFDHKMQKNEKKLQKKSQMFCSIKKKLYLCIAIEKNNGSIAQLNRAFDYGSKGYRFESYWSHSKQETNKCSSLFLWE